MAVYAQQMIEPQVPCGHIRLVAAKDKVDLEIVGNAIGSSHPAEVRLVCTYADQGVTAFINRVTYEEIKLPGFVSPKSKTCQVVSLAVNFTVKKFRKIVKSVNRCWKKGMVLPFKFLQLIVD